MKKSEKTFKNFPVTFWISNILEIFERMAWYGFFAVSSLYITGATSNGGLGFSNQDRGVLQGVVTFFLYLFPVLTGALADRYGYKKMLMASFAILSPAYYLLGQFKTFPSFFMAFMFVAIGAAMFKPVILGTVSKMTDKKNASMGFGIFYMMVNIGGLMGPLIAGYVRAISWNHVFLFSSVWIALNLIIVALFYKEPFNDNQNNSSNAKGLKEVMSGMVEVLGNGRCFLFVFGILFALVMGAKFTANNTISWGQIITLIMLWVVGNIFYDLILRSNNNGMKSNSKKQKSWILLPIKIGDWRFALFLLLMSGFWASYNQLFLTLPLHIRDSVNTSDLMSLCTSFLSFFGLSSLATSLSNSMAIKGQINPEYLINLNAGAIVCFQIFVSIIVTRLKPFTTIFWGVLITVVSFSILALGSSGLLVVFGICVFSFGEMMASPKAKEYTGQIAPPDKIALYMGYFFWSMALGNLFGGILSGQFYAYFVGQLKAPDKMWFSFALIGLISAILIYLYDKTVIKRKEAAEELLATADEPA